MTDNNVGKFVPVSGTLISVSSWDPNKILQDGSSVIMVGVPNSDDNIQTQENFIKQELVSGIESILEDHKYLSYALIASGIEFLGACIDPNDVHKKYESKNRFRKAVDLLFPDSYKAFNNLDNRGDFQNDLYENLRCGVSHVLLPQKNLVLSERKHTGAKHLIVDQSGRLNLVIEDLFEDFKKACEIVIGKLESKEISAKFEILGPNT